MPWLASRVVFGSCRGRERPGGGCVVTWFAASRALSLQWRHVISLKSLPPLAGEGAEGGWGRAEGAQVRPHPPLRGTSLRAPALRSAQGAQACASQWLASGTPSPRKREKGK